jgi:tight adherence protein B
MISPTLITILMWGALILLAGGIIIWGVVSAVSSGEEMQDRIETYALIAETSPLQANFRNRAGVTRFRVRLNNFLSVFVSRSLSVQLMSAHWPITEIEFVLIRIVGVLFGFLLGWLLLRSPISGIGFAILAYLLPGIFLRWSIKNRRMRFNQQLIDALILIEGGVRAGYSLLQALDLVVSELQVPASEEFRRVCQEVGLGLPLSEALINLSDRMQNKDLSLVVTAININSQVGGNLTTMISVVTETIRERIQLFSEVRVLTAQQRYTGYMLTLLPFLVGAILFILNPDYMARIFEPDLLCVPVGALLSILLGNLVIRQMVRIEV